MAEAKLWGIPHTGSIPDPEKQLKKAIEKVLKQAKHDLRKIEHDVESGLKKAGRDVEHGIDKAGDEIKEEFEHLGEEIKDGIEDAFVALLNAGTSLVIDDLVDAIQAKLFHGPIFVKLWWFRFHIDPDTKIDALQAAAQHPPKSKKEIVKMLHELVDDDVIEFRPEAPLIAAFGGKVKVSQIEEALEFVAHKLGLD